MSSTFRIWRERWAAREMVVTRWRAGERTTVAAGEPICDLRVDGVERTLVNTDDERLTWGIYWHYVPEGHEVPPDAGLFEFSYDGQVIAPLTYDPRPRRLAYTRREAYPRAFLSYRRADTEAYAGRLHEALETSLAGRDTVFMDLFSIRPGEPFPWAVQQAAAHCLTMVVVIGPQWLTVTDTHGRRRLDDPADYVRREITAALDRGIHVIPVLAGGGAIPDRDALPNEMHALEQLQMLELTARHWRADLDELLREIERGLRPEGRERE